MTDLAHALVFAAARRAFPLTRAVIVAAVPAGLADLLSLTPRAF